MADVDHTLESFSALENFPLILNLTVSEIFVAAPKGIGCIALSVIPREYEPSILLQGEWVRAMGFANGERIEVVAVNGLLAVEHLDDTVRPFDRYCFNRDRLALLKNFKEELDAIKAAYADMKKREEDALIKVMRRGAQGCEKGNESAGSCDNGHKTGSKAKHRNGGKRMDKRGGKEGEKREGKREDTSEVLAKVSRGERCD